MASLGVPIPALRLLRSCLRFWLKPARTTVKNQAGSTSGTSGLGMNVQAHHRAVHLGPGMKGPGGDVLHDLGLGVKLHAHGQDGHVPRLGAQTLGHFLLHQQHRHRGRMRRLQQMPQDRAGDVIGQVGDDFVIEIEN